MSTPEAEPGDVGDKRETSPRSSAAGPRSDIDFEAADREERFLVRSLFGIAVLSFIAAVAVGYHVDGDTVAQLGIGLPVLGGVTMWVANAMGPSSSKITVGGVVTLVFLGLGLTVVMFGLWLLGLYIAFGP